MDSRIYDLACSCDTTTYPYHEQARTARRAHKCYDCGRVIQPTQWYMDVGGLCEGRWWSGKICCHCWSAFLWVRAHIPCVCVEFGNMHEQLVEICREANSQAPGLLFGLYRRLLGQKTAEKPK